MARPKGSKNKAKVLDGVDYAAQIAEKNTATKSLAEEIAVLGTNIAALNTERKAKEAELKKLNKEIAKLEKKKADADEKIAAELKEREDLRVDYMPQNYEDQLDLSMTPVDFLDSIGEKSERTKIRTYLGSLKYTADEMDHPIRELSGGQKAKVLLLKMSLGNANVLILDEPTRNFSPLSGPVIRKMLREFPGAIISISHDRKYIGEVCGKEYLLEKDGLRLIREEK